MKSENLIIFLSFLFIFVIYVIFLKVLLPSLMSVVATLHSPELNNKTLKLSCTCFDPIKNIPDSNKAFKCS